MDILTLIAQEEVKSQTYANEFWHNAIIEANKPAQTLKQHVAVTARKRSSRAGMIAASKGRKIA